MTTALLVLLACRPSGPWTREAALAPALARIDRDHDGKVVAAEYEATLYEGPPFAKADADGDGVLSLDELDHVRAEQDPTTFIPHLQPDTSSGPRPGPPGQPGARPPGPAGAGGPPPGQPGTLPEGPPGSSPPSTPPEGPPAGSPPGPPPGGSPPGPPPANGLGPAPAVEATPSASCPRVAALSKGLPPPRKHDDIRFVAEVMESLRAEVVAADPAVEVPTIDCLRLAAALGSLDDPPAKAMLAELKTASDAAHVGFPAVLAPH